MRQYGTTDVPHAAGIRCAEEAAEETVIFQKGYKKICIVRVIRNFFLMPSEDWNFWHLFKNLVPGYIPDSEHLE